MSLSRFQNDRLRFLRDWREGMSSYSERDQRFDEWVFLNAASVLLSDKTGELLALSYEELQVDRDGVIHGLARLSAQLKFDYRVLYESNGLLKILVYKQDRLRSVLEEVPFCIMGAKLSYHYPLSPKSFLDELQSRWETSGVVPHEIGLSLGYPVDDVFGYMGLLPLACKGVCGWQVYGCLEESTRRSCAFNDARCQALIFLANEKHALV